VKPDRLAAGVVVQPDSIADQDRRDVEVDLVNQLFEARACSKTSQLWA